MMDNQIMFLETVRLLDPEFFFLLETNSSDKKNQIRVSLRMKRVVLAREQVILK